MAVVRQGPVINVPAAGTITWVGTNFVLAGIYYDGANQAITALGGSRITVDGLIAVPSSATMGMYFAWGRINSTGSDTITRTKAGFYSEGPTCQVRCYTCDDPTKFTLRDYQATGNWPDSPTTGIPATIDTESGDLVDLWIMSDGGGTVSTTISGFTAVDTEQTVNADKSRVYTANSVGSPSISVTGPANAYAALAIVSVYEDTGGGGSDTVTDTISFSDSVVGVTNSDVVAADTISFSDSVVGVTNSDVVVADTITFTDSVLGIQAFEDAVADTWTLTDEVDAEIVGDGIAEDTITFSDSVDGVLAAIGAISDTITFSDSVEGIGELAAIAEDTITFSDSVEGFWDSTSTVSDTITFSDSVEGVGTFQAQSEDTLAFTDEVDAQAPGEAIAEDTLIWSDIVSANLVAVSEVSDTIEFTDSVIGVSPLPPFVPQIFGADPNFEDFRKNKEDLRLQLEAAIARYQVKADRAIVEEADNNTQVIVARKAVQKIVEDVPITEAALDEFTARLEKNLTQVFDEIIKHEEAVKQKTKIDREKRRKRRNDEIMMLF